MNLKNLQIELNCDISPKIFQSLLLYILNLNDISQLITFSKNLTDEELRKLKTCIDQINKNKPLEYITQKCNFYGLNFFVDENVLIPRIETELLVENVINCIKEKFYNRKCKVVDICTGSGVIAISIAKYFENLKHFDIEITAIDISHNALMICDKNINKHNVIKIVKTKKMNILCDFPSENFDIIVSNPPYIESAAINMLEDSVKKYEPHLALDGGSDGLVFYRRLCEIYNDNIILFAEIGYNQGSKILEIFKNYNCSITKDYFGNDRILQIFDKNCKPQNMFTKQANLTYKNPISV